MSKISVTLTSKTLLGIILALGWLLAACTTTGGNKAADAPTATALPPTAAAATAVFTPVPTATVAVSRQLEHNGISLSYDQALLGDVNIQDIPATANQGLFDQPAPAHTWIGFVPEGIVRDDAYHWILHREPQVIVFNLNDFGSFAPADAQAREKIAAFQKLLPERPPTSDGEVPILPPINAAQAMQAQVRWLDFEGGTGVRFLTQFTQEVIPVANDRLVYIFYGMTGDGLHGVTAVFPLAAETLPDTAPILSEADITALNENYESEMAAVTEQLNSLTDSDFSPPLSELDTLAQSITIVPTETDFPVTDAAPQNAQVVKASDIFDAPNNGNSIGALSAGDAVVVNGSSPGSQFRRILCGDGSTGNCWLSSDAIQITDIGSFEPGTPVGLVDGQVVQIQALVENVIFTKPDEAAAQIGSLRVGEVAEVLSTAENGDWYNITCPRNIGVNCWVISNPVVNEATSFFSSNSWKPVIGKYVSFRVPIEWEPTAVSPGRGSVLEEWNLGIPGVESDQVVAFSAASFDALNPQDIENETLFEIGGQPGKKWLRSEQGYVSYDYHTTGIAGAGSFGIHVTVPEADPNLEATMDRLAASVTFSPVEQEKALAQDDSGFLPRFDRYPLFTRQVGDSGILAGLVRQGDGWRMTFIPYPAGADSGNSDYSPTTDRLLTWRSIKGAGPGNLSAGPLTIIDLATQAQQMIVPDNVVSAGWAPNGLDFAYILATPDSYELYWRPAAGEEKLLAVDVPHSLRVSPNGRFVAFTRESHYGLTSAVPGLYVVEIETGKETQVSTLDRAGYGGVNLLWKPTWSPDSSQILLYAAADSDRSATPHEAGYVWAAADGSFSYFLPESTFLSYFDEPLSAPENMSCLGGPPLFAADRMLFRVGECRPMEMGPEISATVDYALDALTGAVTMQQTMTAPTAAELLAWDIAGESLLLHQDGEVVKLSLQ